MLIYRTEQREINIQFSTFKSQRGEKHDGRDKTMMGIKTEGKKRKLHFLESRSDKKNWRTENKE